MRKKSPKQQHSSVRNADGAVERKRLRWTRLGAAALGMAGGLGVILFVTGTLMADSSKPAEIPRVTSGQRGSWGELEYTRIAIEPPEDYISAEVGSELLPIRWVFPAHTRAEVTRLFENADLTAAQRATLLNTSGWTDSPAGVVVSPDRELVLGLTPSARQAIYSVLAQSKENLSQTQPFSFRPERLHERLENSGLSDKTLADFKRLLYPQGKTLCLADATIYVSGISDKQERLKFIRTVSRRNTVLAKLKISSESDMDKLEKYWNYDGRNKEVRPLFESLARVPGGCLIDVAHLLPSFARKRIFTFPDTSNDPLSSKRNCHWTTLNFFNDPADDRFCDPQYVKQVLDTTYSPVTGEERRFGDVLVLFHPGGEALHSAIFIADDLVFTKNGGANTQPWIYMHLEDMLEYYEATCPPDKPPHLVTLRRNNV